MIEYNEKHIKILSDAVFTFQNVIGKSERTQEEIKELLKKDRNDFYQTWNMLVTALYKYGDQGDLVASF